MIFVLGVLFLGADRYVVNNSRYVAPAIPFHALLAAIGVWGISDFLAQWMPPKTSPAPMTENPSLRQRGGGLRARGQIIIPAILAAILIVVAYSRGDDQPRQVANDVMQLRNMHVTAGYWFAEHTDPDQLIALNDVGAIVHISDRPVLDMVGLVSEEVIDSVDGEPTGTCPHDLAVARVMLREAPALVAVFPWFFPCLTAWQGALQPYTVFTITGETVIAGGELVVYFPIWENWLVQAAVPKDATRIDAKFEQGITLSAYQAEQVEEGVQITLWWTADDTPLNDYTVFFHVIDESDEIVAQRDGVLVNGQFETTWLRRGDIVRDVRIVPYAGDLDNLRIRTGMYELAFGTRLPRLDPPADQPDMAIFPLTLTSDS
jgi:hypothetical protein